MPSAWGNERPVEDFNLRVESVSPLRSAPTLDRASLALPGAHGHVPNLVATTPFRIITLTTITKPATHAEHVAMNDRITEWLTGLIEFRTADQPDRLLYCYLRADEAEAAGSPKFVVPRQRNTFELIAFDAARYDRHERVLRISSTPTPVRTGSLDGGGTLLLFDVSSSTIIRSTTMNGAVLGSMTLTGSTPTNGWWELDTWHQTIESVTSAGVRSNASALLTAGDWFAFVAATGDREVNAAGRLEVTSGRALLYRRNRYR